MRAKLIGLLVGGCPLIAAFILLASSSLALGQGTVLQGGPVTAGRAPMYVSSGTSQPVIQDSGPAGGGAAGLGLSEQLLVARGTGTPPYVGQGTGALGTNWCDYDAPITNATGYHYLCLSPNSGNGGLLAYGAGGGAAQQPLRMNLNGTSYEFPFVLSGVAGPSTSVVNNAACWNNTSGTLLKDCGGTPVLSVGLALPSIFAVSGSPVTSTGTLTATFNTQTANTIFSGPTSGGVATPTFRSLVPADIPSAVPSTKSTFTATGTGAVTRTVQSKLQGLSVSPLDYGATCNGVADDSSAIALALNAIAAAGGGSLYISGGLICEAHGLGWSSPNNLHIYGDGKGSVLALNSTSADLLDVSGGTVQVSDLWVYHPTLGAVSNSVHFFTFVNATGYLNDMFFNNGGSIAAWGDKSGGGADNIQAAGMTGNGFEFDVSHSATPAQQYGNIILNNLAFQGTASTTGFGLTFTSGDGFEVANSVVAGFINNVVLHTSASRSYLANLLFSNVAADGAGGPAGSNSAFDLDGTNQFLGRISLTGCYLGAMGGNGMYVKNAYTVGISNTIVIDNTGRGILIDTGTKDFKITGSTITGNGNSTVPGIDVLSGANNISIENNKSGTTRNGTSSGTTSNTQTYGVVIENAATTNYFIVGNDLTGNITSGLLDNGGGSSGTTKQVSLNTVGAYVP